MFLKGFSPVEKTIVLDIISIPEMKLRGYTKITKKTVRVHAKCIDFGWRFDNFDQFVQHLKRYS